MQKKQSLVYGWSPYQLVNVPIDKPPALEHNTVSQTFANHLNALHAGRRAFIKAELIRCGTEFKDMQSKQLNLNNNNAKPVREKIHPTGIYDSEDDEEKNNRNEEQEPLQNENDHQQNIQHSQMQYDDNEQVDQNLAPGAAFDNCDQTDENEDAKVGIDFAKDVQEWRKAQDVD
ncbi:unnamed protein product [Mytilus edulis]|uniref:Uncharacterized protein n=1 Tax=Mytilus edulis TaxID=6550 RepID=A0A8S3UPL4_MYTED|nr:unnamed protein product [Mytilus edulis]